MSNLENLTDKPRTWGGKRENSGRKVGSKNKKTVEEAMAYTILRQKVLDNIEEIVDAQIELAKKGDKQAADSLLDRVFGRASQHIDTTSDETREELEQIRLDLKNIIDEQH